MAIELHRVYWDRVRAAQRALGLPESTIARRVVRRVYHKIAFGPPEDSDNVVLASIFGAMEWEPPMGDS